MGIRSQHANIKIVKRSNAGANITTKSDTTSVPLENQIDSTTLKFSDDAVMTEWNGINYDYYKIYSDGNRMPFQDLPEAIYDTVLELGKNDIQQKTTKLYEFRNFLNLFTNTAGKRSDNDYQITSNGALLEQTIKMGLVEGKKSRVRTWYTLTPLGKNTLNFIGGTALIPFDADIMIPKRRSAPVREYLRTVSTYNSKKILLGYHGNSYYPSNVTSVYDSKSPDYAQAIQFVDFEPDASSVKNPRFQAKQSGYDTICKKLLEDIGSKPLIEIKPMLSTANAYENIIYFYGENKKEGMLFRIDTAREYNYFVKKYGKDCQILLPEKSVGYNNDKTYTHAVVKHKDKVVGLLRLHKQTTTPEQEAFQRKNNLSKLNYTVNRTHSGLINQIATTFAFWDKLGKLPK